MQFSFCYSLICQLEDCVEATAFSQSNECNILKHGLANLTDPTQDVSRIESIEQTDDFPISDRQQTNPMVFKWAHTVMRPSNATKNKKLKHFTQSNESTKRRVTKYEDRNTNYAQAITAQQHMPSASNIWTAVIQNCHEGSRD